MYVQWEWVYGKVDEATDYVDVVDNLDLTYDEFMALSDEEKMAYLSGTSNWLTTLYPNVEMEEGIYEITVPLGVDMSATYNVTVSGSVETDRRGKRKFRSSILGNGSFI